MELRDHILATLAYYDVLDRPLNIDEIYRYLVRFEHLQLSSPTLPDKGVLLHTLHMLQQEGIVTQQAGQYFLFDRAYVIPLRKKHEQLAHRKIELTRRVVTWLKHVPFVRAVFASGSLSLRNTNELSDLDILIIAKHGHVWTARLLVALVLSFLGIRRTHQHVIAPNKICANHYITDQSLEIPFQSLYTAQLYANLELLYIDDQALLQQFKNANAWMQHYVYTWHIQEQSAQRSLIKKIAEKLFVVTLWEQWFKQIQLKRIQRNENATNTGRITYSDTQLEFHPQSPEGRIIPAYNERLKKLGLPDTLKEKDSGLT